MSIPIVIFHIGSQDYFKKCVLINSKNNVVYIIGDDTNKDLFKDNNNVRFYHIDKLNDDEIMLFKYHFMNNITKPGESDFLFFVRVFYLRKLMLLEKLSNAFFMDSDAIVFDNINNFFSPADLKNNYYCLELITQITNPYYMVGALEFSLLDLNFCNKYVELCNNIYVNNSMFHLIEKKYYHHINNNIPGGISDMTLYYLLYSEKLLDNIVDTTIPFMIGNELCVFDHNISYAYGYLGANTYKMSNNIKLIHQENGSYYVETYESKKIKLLGMHFQGGTKSILANLN